jgi:hypothetical protein
MRLAHDLGQFRRTQAVGERTRRTFLETSGFK